MLKKLFVCFIAGAGAGIGTGLAGLSAAAVIAPMLITVLLFTFVGSYTASFLPQTTMGNFSLLMTLLAGLKFIFKPVMAAKESKQNRGRRTAFVQSVFCGIAVGLICGFVGAGGGMLMLLVLVTVLGYELKTAVGTSVFIMTFTALTGACSHFILGNGITDYSVFILCIVFTLFFATLTAKFANRASPQIMNRMMGFGLLILSIAIIIINYI